VWGRGGAGWWGGVGGPRPAAISNALCRRVGSWWWQAAEAGGYLAAINSSSELVLQVVAVDVLIDISTLRALVATGGANAELYFLDSVGSETLP